MKLTTENLAKIEAQLSDSPGAFDLLLNLMRAETASEIAGYLDDYDNVVSSFNPA
jgi:hypothetical protein